MPLPKPDKAEIQRIRKERSLWFDRDENLFDPISEAVLGTLSEGFIDRTKARELVEWFEKNHKISSIYPHKQLLSAIKTAIGEDPWNPESEKDLIHFISTVYPDIESIFDLSWPHLITAPPPLLGNLYQALFDTPDTPPNIQDKLCAFTGPFRNGTRKECYQAVRNAGGVPCDVREYTDYLFVASSHIENGVVSSSMIAGIASRMRFGHTCILAEEHFPLLS